MLLTLISEVKISKYFFPNLLIGQHQYRMVDPYNFFFFETLITYLCHMTLVMYLIDLY